MNIVLTPETQKLLEEQMKKGGYTDPEAVVRLALENLGHVDGERFEELPADVQAAIETAEAQSAHGEGRPWATVKEELRADFPKVNTTVHERYRLHILPQASTDLIQIFEFIQQDSPQNAATMIQQLFDAIDSLDRLPHRSRIHRSTIKPSRIVHAMTVAPFIIYFRVLETERLVEVLTVRHGARKQPKRFSN